MVTNTNVHTCPVPMTSIRISSRWLHTNLHQCTTDLVAVAAVVDVVDAGTVVVVQHRRVGISIGIGHLLKFKIEMGLDQDEQGQCGGVVTSERSSSVTGAATWLTTLVHPFQNCLPEESTKLKVAMATASNHWAANRSQARVFVIRRW